MKIKYNYLNANEVVNNLGYTLISDTYKNTHEKLILKDDKGYFYTSSLSNLLKNKHLRFIDKSNIYTIPNIRLWCKLNNKLLELISNKYEGSHKKLQWKCLNDNCGEIFETNWANIQTGYGCPYCAGKQVGVSNCLAAKYPDLAIEWHPTKNGDITPYNVTCSSSFYAWWQCQSGHEWIAVIYSRTLNKNGCPYCSGRFPTKENNLLVKFPEIASEWDYKKNKFGPECYTSVSGQDIWWICKNGHEWLAPIESRTNMKSGCPYCARKLPTKDYNLLICNPTLCEEWDYDKNNKKPDEYLPNSNKKVHWKCKNCDHKWVATINNRNNGRGCLQCNQSKGEQKIKKWLDNNNIVYNSQKDFYGLNGIRKGSLSYDFYLPDYNLLVEYQGEFHDGSAGEYTKKNLIRQKEHDKRKREYAKINNIDLLEIWYWDSNNVETILTNKIFNIST